MMGLWLPFAGFVFLLGALLLFRSSRKSMRARPSSSTSYARMDALFTPEEQQFLRLLEKAVDPGHRVFGKVRLADLVKPVPGLSGHERQTALNRLYSRRADFVVCEASNLRACYVVQLDDQVGAPTNRQERDPFVDTALTQADLPVFHFSARQVSEVEDLRRMLGRDPVQDPIREGSELIPTALSRVCSSCGAKMQRRRATRGPMAGREFWGCSGYPECRAVELLSQRGESSPSLEDKKG